VGVGAAELGAGGDAVVVVAGDAFVGVVAGDAVEGVGATGCGAVVVVLLTAGAVAWLADAWALE
jgi:hypothetical protein